MQFSLNEKTYKNNKNTTRRSLN